MQTEFHERHASPAGTVSCRERQAAICAGFFCAWTALASLRQAGPGSWKRFSVDVETSLFPRIGLLPARIERSPLRHRGIDQGKKKEDSAFALSSLKINRKNQTYFAGASAGASAGFSSPAAGAASSAAGAASSAAGAASSAAGAASSVAGASGAGASVFAQPTKETELKRKRKMKSFFIARLLFLLFW